MSPTHFTKPRRKRILKEEREWKRERDGWGRCCQTGKGEKCEEKVENFEWCKYTQ